MSTLKDLTTRPVVAATPDEIGRGIAGWIGCLHRGRWELHAVLVGATCPVLSR